MAFGSRAVDEVSLRTVVTLAVEPERVVLDLETDGADVPWSLQLTFRDGGTVTGVSTDAATGETVLVAGTGTHRAGGSTITFGPGGGTGHGQPAFYAPGQDYAFLGGTDRPEGQHVHVTGRAPGRTRLVLGTPSTTGAEDVTTGTATAAIG